LHLEFCWIGCTITKPGVNSCHILHAIFCSSANVTRSVDGDHNFRSTRLTHWLLSCLPVLQNLVMDKLFARNIGNKEKPHVKKIIFTHKNTTASCGMQHYLATRVAENLDLRESSTSYKVDILQTTFLEVPELLRDVLLLLRQWAREKRSWWELDPLEFHEKVDDDHRVANLPIVLDQ